MKRILTNRINLTELKYLSEYEKQIFRENARNWDKQNVMMKFKDLFLRYLL